MRFSRASPSSSTKGPEILSETTDAMKMEGGINTKPRHVPAGVLYLMLLDTITSSIPYSSFAKLCRRSGDKSKLRSGRGSHPTQRHRSRVLSADLPGCLLPGPERHIF